VTELWKRSEKHEKNLELTYKHLLRKYGTLSYVTCSLEHTSHSPKMSIIPLWADFVRSQHSVPVNNSRPHFVSPCGTGSFIVPPAQASPIGASAPLNMVTIKWLHFSLLDNRFNAVFTLHSLVRECKLLISSNLSPPSGVIYSVEAVWCSGKAVNLYSWSTLNRS